MTKEKNIHILCKSQIQIRGWTYKRKTSKFSLYIAWI